MHINPSTQSVIAEDDVQENEVVKENVDKSVKGENVNVCRHENNWRHGRHASGTKSREMMNRNAEDHKVSFLKPLYEVEGLS